MARVIFLRLDPRSSAQLGPVLVADGHEVHVERESAPIGVVRGSSAVFIGGGADGYLPVLRRLRALDPKLCLVVIARAADTQGWLDAIEAGATDYWPAPFEASQVRALIEPSPKPRTYATAALRTGRVGHKPDGKAEAMPHN